MNSPAPTSPPSPTAPTPPGPTPAAASPTPIPAPPPPSPPIAPHPTPSRPPSPTAPTTSASSTPRRPWVLRPRAAARRITDYSAFVDNKWALRFREAHSVLLRAPLLRRLCAPVELEGIEIRYAVNILGRDYGTILSWARRG